MAAAAPAVYDAIELLILVLDREIMAGAALKLMEPDEFLLWCTRQEARYELVDGEPVEMMAGDSGLHDRVVTNVIIALGTQLRSTPCRPTTADIAVRTRIRSFRRPDVTVTCDPPRGDVYEAQEPRMVIEVLSPSNAGVSWERKLREYRRLEALDSSCWSTPNSSPRRSTRARATAGMTSMRIAWRMPSSCRASAAA